MTVASVFISLNSFVEPERLLNGGHSVKRGHEDES